MYLVDEVGGESASVVDILRRQAPYVVYRVSIVRGGSSDVTYYDTLTEAVSYTASCGFCVLKDWLSGDRKPLDAEGEKLLCYWAIEWDYFFTDEELLPWAAEKFVAEFEKGVSAGVRKHGLHRQFAARVILHAEAAVFEAQQEIQEEEES